jgi:protein-disulfide isomerase
VQGDARPCVVIRAVVQRSLRASQETLATAQCRMTDELRTTSAIGLPHDGRGFLATSKQSINKMSDKLDRFLSGVLALAAVLIAVALVHREFYGRRPPSTPLAAGPPVYLENWKSLLDSGAVIGDVTAAVKVIEFGDFECPFCRVFDSTFHAVAKPFGKAVALDFIEFPLRMHRFAMPAARAAECAGDQGKFAEYHDRLYQRQDSFGLRPWSAYAVDAGVPDTLRFSRCAHDTAAVRRIRAGAAVGRSLSVHATPTVIVNGWRFSTPPEADELARVITALIAGNDPFPRSKAGGAN